MLTVKHRHAGLDTCDKGGTERHGRRAIVAFACSLNGPLINRTALVGQDRVRKLIDGFGFAMPPAAATGGTPPSTAAVMGQIAGAPRRVHHMSATILASLDRARHQASQDAKPDPRL